MCGAAVKIVFILTKMATILPTRICLLLLLLVQVTTISPAPVLGKKVAKLVHGLHKDGHGHGGGFVGHAGGHGHKGSHGVGYGGGGIGGGGYGGSGYGGGGFGGGSYGSGGFGGGGYGGGPAFAGAAGGATAGATAGALGGAGGTSLNGFKFSFFNDSFVYMYDHSDVTLIGYNI